MIVTKKYKNQNDTLIIFSKKGQIRPHIILAMLRNINPRFHNNMSSIPRFERKRRIARVNISINLWYKTGNFGIKILTNIVYYT